MGWSSAQEGADSSNTVFRYCSNVESGESYDASVSAAVMQSTHGEVPGFVKGQCLLQNNELTNQVVDDRTL